MQNIGILDDVVSGVNYLGQSASSYTYFTSSAPASGASIDLNIDGGTGTYNVIATIQAYNAIPGGAELGRSTAEGILVEHFTYIKPPTGTKERVMRAKARLPPGHTYLDAAVMPTTDHSNTR